MRLCDFMHDCVMLMCNSQDMLMGGGLAAKPRSPSMSDDDDDPRACKLALPPPSKASSSSSGAKAPAAAPPPSVAPPPIPPPLKASSSSGAKAAAKAPSAPPGSPPSPHGSESSTDFFMGGVAKAPGKANAKAGSKKKPKKNKQELMVPAIGDGFVYYEEYIAPLRVVPYGNWTFYCKRPGCPADCQRTLGVLPRNMKLTDNQLEPLAFLHAWRDCVIDPIKGHRKSHPTNAVVQAFFDDHQDELEALKALFVAP